MTLSIVVWFSSVVVIIHWTFHLWRDIIDEIEDWIMSFMMEFTVRVMVEYVLRSCFHDIQIVHNLSLQGNTLLMEMLHNSSPVRCRGLLQMQLHIFTRLCDELRTKNYLHFSWYISVYEKVTMFLLMIWNNCRNFLVQDAFQIRVKTVILPFHPVLQQSHIEDDGAVLTIYSSAYYSCWRYLAWLYKTGSTYRFGYLGSTTMAGWLSSIMMMRMRKMKHLRDSCRPTWTVKWTRSKTAC